MLPVEVCILCCTVQANILLLVALVNYYFHNEEIYFVTLKKISSVFSTKM